MPRQDEERDASSLRPLTRICGFTHQAAQGDSDNVVADSLPDTEAKESLLFIGSANIHTWRHRVYPNWSELACVCAIWRMSRTGVAPPYPQTGSPT